MPSSIWFPAHRYWRSRCAGALPRERKVPDVRVAEIEIDPAQSRGRRKMQVSQFNGVRCLVAAS